MLSFQIPRKGEADKTERYNAGFSRSPLQIRGQFSIQGPQAVNDEGGCPTYVAEIFRSHPDIRQIGISTKSSGVVYTRPLTEGEEPEEEPVSYRFISEEKLKSMFSLAEIPILRTYKMVNKYDRSEEAPWWLVKTPYGLIELGWRKNVISLNWEDTSLRELVTQDNVTSETTCVHAWGIPKLVEYLTELGRRLRMKETS